jgi:hypothetical protein
VPASADLAQDAAARAWINAYVPPKGNDAGDDPQAFAGRNIVWAAYVWHDLKRHWTLEAQRTVRAQQARAGGARASSLPPGAPK